MKSITLISQEEEKNLFSRYPKDISPTIAELSFVLFLSGVFSGLAYLTDTLLSTAHLFFLSIAFLVQGMIFITLFLKRMGSVVLFLVIYCLLTFDLNEIEVVGWKKLTMLFMIGVIFEVFNYSAKKTALPNSIILIISAITTSAIFPLILAFMLSVELTLTFPLSLYNLITLSAITGLSSSLLAVIVWMVLKRRKVIIKLKSYFGSLA